MSVTQSGYSHSALLYTYEKDNLFTITCLYCTTWHEETHLFFDIIADRRIINISCQNILFPYFFRSLFRIVISTVKYFFILGSLIIWVSSLLIKKGFIRNHKKSTSQSRCLNSRATRIRTLNWRSQSPLPYRLAIALYLICVTRLRQVILYYRSAKNASPFLKFF